MSKHPQFVSLFQILLVKLISAPYLKQQRTSTVLYIHTYCICIHVPLDEPTISVPLSRDSYTIQSMGACMNYVVAFLCLPVHPSSLAAEAQLKDLCLIPSGVDQLTIYTTRSDSPLGNGDATLIVDEGTVEMETVVHYAVILHGPFVYSAGFKPASVVVYLNLKGANLLKPVKLMLKHWCKPVEVSGALKLLRAPHTTGEMENFRYIFHEVQGVLLHNTATFTISEPQCLYCVEMKEESQASYNAIAFQKNLPEDGDVVKFRIQLMCDCLEWNAVSTCTVLKTTVHLVLLLFLYLVSDGDPGTTTMGE